jgi:c-di-GMP-binding flagellar brake protein YcgR
MATTRIATEPVEQFLESACARQTAAELHFERGDGELIIARVRLLLFSDHKLLADRPVYADNRGTIPLGRPLKVHIAFRGSRYEFESVIESEFRRAPGHTPWTGPGIVLRRPTSVSPSQRRASVRVSVMGCDPIQVISAKPCASGAVACSLDDPVYHGWMIDISAGGLSMVIDRESARPVRCGDELYVTFRLPDGDSEFNMFASVRHLRPVAEGESIRLALAFRNWPGGRLKPDRQRIARFVAERERLILKRLRSG